MELFQNNYYIPKREELESILRRVDHSGDHMINFDEFCEITSVNEMNLSLDKIEENNERLTPQSKEINDEVKYLRKSNSK